MHDKLQQLKDRFNNLLKKNKSDGAKGIFHPFWDMNSGETLKGRFIKDSNPENELEFAYPKFEHTISINGKDKKVPCLTNWGEQCPICDVSKQHYAIDKANGNQKSEKGLYYYKKKRYVSYFFVLEDPLKPAEGQENKVHKCVALQLEKKLVEKILADVVDPDDGGMAAAPWDLRNGYDFFLKKTISNNQNDFVLLSKFSKRQSSLTDAQIESIEPIDLRTLLPKNPGLEKVQQMLQAHLNGTLYEENDKSADSDDSVKQNDAQSSKPSEQPSVTTNTVEAPVATSVVDTNTAIPVSTSENTSSSNKSEEDEMFEFLAKRRAKQDSK